MRAEPLLSQHRQKPWVSKTKIFEVDGLISRADGELSDPVDLVLARATGLEREVPNTQARCAAFSEERAPKKGRNDLEGPGFLVREMESKGTRTRDLLGVASGAKT